MLLHSAALCVCLNGVFQRRDRRGPERVILRGALHDSLNNRRFSLLLVGVFALAALLLASTGVFGVLAYSVAQRTREIGVRIALGATPLQILRMVLGQGPLTVAVGLAIGLAGSLLLIRTMRPSLFEISPNDPLTIPA